MKLSAVIAAAAILAFSFGSAHAQVLTLDGGFTDANHGHSVSAGPDIDGDGTPEFIVGANLDGFALGEFRGSVTSYNGATGAVFVTLFGDNVGDQFGTSVAFAGDVNNDGTDDLIVGIPGHDDGADENIGAARVVSGADGSQLWQFVGDAPFDVFGAAVSGARDVDNDGFDDVIVGAFGNDTNGSFAGQAKVFSGRTGLALYTLFGEAANDNFGTSVAGGCDINNDGRPDVIVGAPGNGASDRGAVYVYSGLDGSLVHKIPGAQADDFMGGSVACAGDFNGDGRQDVVAGAPDADLGGTSRGVVSVFSGIDASALLRYEETQSGVELGFAVSALGDLDGNGTEEVIAGGPAGPNGLRPGEVAFFTFGLDDKADDFRLGSNSGEFGAALALVGDVTGDGLPDYLVGAPSQNAGGLVNAGRAFLFAGEALPCRDADGDGYGVPGSPVCSFPEPDCDDTNPAVNPGATEVCDDDVDNDCDGQIDDADPDCAPDCTDADGDGFSIEGGACGPIDCDDANPAVSPGATEVCNQIDDDCDTDVDEGFDADGDGFFTCTGDCDDTNPGVNPGAPEIPGNGVDENCNGNDMCGSIPLADGSPFGAVAVYVGVLLALVGIRRRRRA